MTLIITYPILGQPVASKMGKWIMAMFSSNSVLDIDKKNIQPFLYNLIQQMTNKTSNLFDIGTLPSEATTPGRLNKKDGLTR